MTEPAIRELGAALGLFGTDGELDGGWLSEPLERLASVLTNETQRAALGRFLDEVIPGPSSDRPGYHPLLWTGDPARAPKFGNLYLVLSDDEISVAGEVHTDGGEPFALGLSVRVPLFAVVGDELVPALETSGTIDVGLELDLPPSTGNVALDAIRATVSIAPRDPVVLTPRIVLAGFRLGTAAPRDLELDGSDWAGSALDMVLGLLHDAIAQAPEPFRSHLLPLLGLDPAFPKLPLLDIVRDGDAFRRWLATLKEQGRLGDWWSHLGQLFGSGAATGAGSGADPWRASIIAGDVDLALTLAVADGKLFPGASIRLGPAASLHGSGDLVLLGLPLTGALEVDLLPTASVTLRSPAPLLPPVLGTGGTVVASCHQARAGFSLARGRPAAVIELVVTLAAPANSSPRPHLMPSAIWFGAIEALLVAALGDRPATPPPGLRERWGPIDDVVAMERSGGAAPRLRSTEPDPRAGRDRRSPSRGPGRRRLRRPRRSSERCSASPHL
ncbi:MAG: hypothetical protein R3B72_36010 [Polyangiaceae bacterium]